MHGLILAFFEAMVHQDSEKLTSYFKANATILWPNTNEQFTVNEYVEVTCKYPGIWNGSVERIEALDGEYFVLSKISSEDINCSYHVLSLIKFEEDQIIRLEEYYSEDGNIPNWREVLQIGKKIN